jgi:IS30 family transposase
MYKHLISEQRYAIYLMLQKDMSQKDIAAAIGVSPQLLQGSYRDYNRQKHRLAGHEKTAPWQRCK